jgi:hypothetical protein
VEWWRPTSPIWGAKYGNPEIFVSLVTWADHIITE